MRLTSIFIFIIILSGCAGTKHRKAQMLTQTWQVKEIQNDNLDKVLNLSELLKVFVGEGDWLNIPDLAKKSVKSFSAVNFYEDGTYQIKAMGLLNVGKGKWKLSRNGKKLYVINNLTKGEKQIWKIRNLSSQGFLLDIPDKAHTRIT